MKKEYIAFAVLGGGMFVLTMIASFFNQASHDVRSKAAEDAQIFEKPTPTLLRHPTPMIYGEY